VQTIAHVWQDQTCENRKVHDDLLNQPTCGETKAAHQTSGYLPVSEDQQAVFQSLGHSFGPAARPKF
jgi:hypothetical protein